METNRLTERFCLLFREFVVSPDETRLAEASEIGERLVRSDVPPEEIADLFDAAIRMLAEDLPDVRLRDIADRLAVPLVELLIAYGLAFREQIDRKREYEETRMAARIIEQAGDGIWMADGDGRMIIVNPAFSRITGVPLEKIPGMAWRRFGWSGAASAFGDAPETGRSFRKIEVSAVRPDGTAYTALLTARKVPAEGGRPACFIGILDDITDRKRREELFKLELARARSIYDLAVHAELPVVERLTIHARFLPTEHFGGDALEAIRLDERRLLLLMADVTGHGVPAAMTANTLKILFREMAKSRRSPADICARLNREMARAILPDDMIAGFCGLIDLREMTLSYCLAGIPSPLILRDNLILRLQPNAMMIGVFDDAEYEVATISLRPGDRIVLMTDGVVEARNADGELFGIRRVQECLIPFLDKDICPVDAILFSARAFQESGQFKDDVLLVSCCLNEKIGSNPKAAWSRFSAGSRCAYAAQARNIEIDPSLEIILSDIHAETDVDSYSAGKLKIALFEVLSNAVEHGSLEMTAHKKDADFYDTPDYWALFRARKGSEEYGRREVRVTWAVQEERIEVTVTDQGPGFSPSAVTTPLDERNTVRPSGRGIHMARMAADSVLYSAKGNRVTIVMNMTKTQANGRKA